MPKGVYDRNPVRETIDIPDLQSGTPVVLGQSDRQNLVKAQRQVAAVPTIEKAIAGKDMNTLFPVTLFKNYRPVGHFQYQDEDGVWQDPGELDPENKASADLGLAHKLSAGGTYRLPLPEAKELIARHLAERADALPE